MKYEQPQQAMATTESATAYPHQDVFRALAGVMIIAMLATTSALQPSAVLILTTVILIYILSTHVVSRLFKEAAIHRAQHAFGFLDALLVGVFMAYINFSLLPSTLLMLMLLHCAINSGGALRSLENSIGAALGAIGYSTLVAPPLFELQLELQPGLISLAALALYLCIYSFYNYSSHRGLQKRLSSLNQQMLQLKLRTYKLSKYLSPALRKEILSGKEVKLETQRKKLTIFFSDIKGFSELAEEMEAEALTALLNNYLTEMSDIALKFGGTIDKFIGDSIMVFFGDPNSRGAKADAVACVSMAIAMKKHMKQLQLRWASQGIQKPLEIRMGINTGYCTVGNFGTENRLDYTLLGTEVNLASRLESAANPGEILVSHESYALVKDVISCDDKGEINVKGYQKPIKVYSAIDMRKNLGKHQSYFEQALDGFSVYMDLDKINNYDRERILKSLKDATSRLEHTKKG